TIVTSFVKDLLMPPIGLALGGVNFEDLFVTLSGGSYPSLAAAKAAGAPTLNYGIFINTIINFVIVAFAVFMLVRQIDRMRAKPAPPSPSTKECPQCAMAIPLRAVRCPHCTSNVGGPGRAPPPPPPPPRPRAALAPQLVGIDGGVEVSHGASSVESASHSLISPDSCCTASLRSRVIARTRSPLA